MSACGARSAPGRVTAVIWRASIRRRSRAYMTWRTVARARTASSSMPAAGRRGGPQGDREGDHLVVVEEQRRQFRARAEPVSAVRAFEGGDGIAEFAQAVDVAADGARADVQPFRQQRARPVPAGLEQGEQGQQPRRGLLHGSMVHRSSGHILASSAGTVGLCPRGGHDRHRNTGTPDNRNSPHPSRRRRPLWLRRPPPPPRSTPNVPT